MHSMSLQIDVNRLFWKLTKQMQNNANVFETLSSALLLLMLKQKQHSRLGVFGSHCRHLAVNDLTNISAWGVITAAVDSSWLKAVKRDETGLFNWLFMCLDTSASTNRFPGDPPLAYLDRRQVSTYSLSALGLGRVFLALFQKSTQGSLS